MKLKIFNTTGNQVGEIELPSQFSEAIREDVIKKAVLTIQNNQRQSYGSYKEAGQRHAVKISKRRRDYKASYGKGISRVPRKTLSRRGSQFFWQGANAPGTVGGRKAHPPKVEKVWQWKINTKENRKAICSALSAVMFKDKVLQRGHLLPSEYPFVLSDDFEKINKTKQLLDALIKIGFKEELTRAGVTKERAGKGKRRGRRKITRKGLLMVVLNVSDIKKAVHNIPGIDVINVKKLNAEVLAPGGSIARATLFTLPALEELRKGLFTNKKINQEQIKNSKKIIEK